MLEEGHSGLATVRHWEGNKWTLSNEDSPSCSGHSLGTGPKVNWHRARGPGPRAHGHDAPEQPCRAEELGLRD